MHQTHLHHTLILGFLLLMLGSSVVMASSRLTVVVVVDGLNQTDLNTLRPYWPQGGLRILSEEAYQTEVGFPQQVYGGVETLATLLTGTTPSEHGIVMNQYFSRRDRQVYSILEDSEVEGIGTHIGYSPRALLVPTLSDEMRMQYGAASQIYAVGINPEVTTLLAGHAANACCWIGAPTPSDSLRWVSTSFYSEGLPASADEMNTNGRFHQIASRIWTPRMEINMYNSPTDEERKKSFSYRASDVLTHSPQANSLVVELALALQKEKQLGTDMVPDMLLMEMTVVSPHAGSDIIRSAEQEDMYLGVNQDLGFLIEQLNKRIGREHYQLLVMGRPCLGTPVETMEKAGMPIHSFNIEQAAALCSTYLMALYGHERWVDGGYGQSIYLNRTLIEQKRLSLQTIQQQVADFLMEFEGIKMACPAYMAYLNPQLSPSINKQFTGDVVFLLRGDYRLTATGYDGKKGETEIPVDMIPDMNPTSPILFYSNKRTFPEAGMTAIKVKHLLKD